MVKSGISAPMPTEITRLHPQPARLLQNKPGMAECLIGFAALAIVRGAHDADGAFALCSADFVDHALPPGSPAGMEGSRRFFKEELAAFPDLRATMTELFAEGDKVADRMEIEGTHLGPLMGIPPTGKHVKFSLINIHRIADGKIAGHWSRYRSPRLRSCPQHFCATGLP